jgi:signal peptidase II
MEASLKNRIILIAATLVVFALDRMTKILVATTMQLGESRRVLGEFFRLTYITNSNGVMGISFGPQTRYLMLPLSLLAMAAIVYFYLRSLSRSAWVATATGLILGGAAGNMLDRFRSGAVVDFIDWDIPNIAIPAFKLLLFRFPGFYLDRWYTFNIADSAVLSGVALLLIITFKEEFKQKTATGPNNKH